MPIRHVKDTSRLVARTKLRGRQRRHYLFAYLWEDREAMRAQTGETDPECLGLHTPNGYEIKFNGEWENVRTEAPPLLGEVHFIRGRWTMEIVTHELCHALLHRLRAGGSLLQMVLEQNPMDAEEAVCHEFGWWAEQAWRWLWEIDPHGKHAPQPEGGP